MVCVCVCQELGKRCIARAHTQTRRERGGGGVDPRYWVCGTKEKLNGGVPGVKRAFYPTSAQLYTSRVSCVVFCT